MSETTTSETTCRSNVFLLILAGFIFDRVFHMKNFSNITFTMKYLNRRVFNEIDYFKYGESIELPKNAACLVLSPQMLRPTPSFRLY